MEDRLVEVRSAAARSMADKKEYERDIKTLNRPVSTGQPRPSSPWKGREDLARGALSAKQRAEREIDSRRQALQAIEEVSVRRQDDLEKLQAKLDEAKTKHRALIVRRRSCRTKGSRCARASRSNKVDEAMRRLRPDRTQGRRNGSLCRSDHVGDRSPRSTVQELAAEELIEKELAQIKRRRGGAPAPAPAAPGPGPPQTSEGEGA